MPSIRFSCEATLPRQAPEIAAQILELERWPDFQGYGPLPGIKSAEFETRCEGEVGTRIRVTNTDGSQHSEEIRVWKPEEELVLEFSGFVPPLSWLALGFTERWIFAPDAAQSGATKVTRSFELRPRFILTWLPLWFISLLLRRALARHLQSLREAH